MPTTRLTVKDMPRGWRVLQMARSQNDPSQAFVLCERDPHDEHDLNFVTWSANLTMGGCHHGNYFDDMRSAEQDFNKRKANLL
jgi:hypothetical protein